MFMKLPQAAKTDLVDERLRSFSPEQRGALQREHILKSPDSEKVVKDGYCAFGCAASVGEAKIAGYAWGRSRRR